MARTYVALDLETTGLDPVRDAIIEVGAVRFDGQREAGEFCSFVNPGRRIPQEITELTGIRDSDVAKAPGIHVVLADLAHFVGDSLIVGHSVGFDLGFLRQHSDQFPNDSLDTFELAGVLLPNAERYSLQELSRLLEIELDNAHRALADARATQCLYEALLWQAAAVPVGLLKEILRHATKAGWGAAGFFRQALELAAASGPGVGQPERPSRLAVDRPLAAEAPPALHADLAPLTPVAEHTALDADALAAVLDADGPFAARFPGYEHRPQQITMLRRVAQTFNLGGQLLVEAPTGVGKSLAYLVPAAHWAAQNGERVVISTNTINLQEQLLRKDVPELAAALPFETRAVVLKGRSHYLCQARLAALRRRGPSTPDEARVLAKVLLWQPTMVDGDGDELFLPSATEQSIWRQLSADNEGCDIERCAHYRNNQCYFYRARRRAESAHLVIVNHALLLSDVAVDNRAIPEYKYLIVDEAHHLEGATTDSLSFDLGRADLLRILNQIGAVSESGRVVGLLADLLGVCRKARADQQTFELLELLVGKVGIAGGRAVRALNSFFDQLGYFLSDQADGRQSQYEVRIRVTSGLRVQPAWDSVEIAWDNARLPLKTVVDGTERLSRVLGEVHLSDLPEWDDLQLQLLSAARVLAEASGQISSMISEPSSSQVCWLSAGSQNGNSRADEVRVHAAPVRIGPLVEQHLFHKKEAVILTSATLRTNGTFDFVREQLGAYDADELAVGSPFDYRNSTLVYLVDDIAEPDKPGYQRSLEQGLTALFRATEGRALGLFTSYNQLRATQRGIRAPLAQAGITVQAQGEGVSRRQLLENFRTGERRVLLGTRSFWEGVDVSGEALSCLAIAKLPFNVPSDPVFAARAETYDDPFMEYAVPDTILRFLQGFGRLIRTRTDRGVVAVFDVRLLTKSYGELFVQSLPDPTVRRGPLAQLPQAAQLWLEQA